MQLKFIITAAISAMLLACGCQKPAAITEQPATNPENPPPKPPAVRTDGCCVIYVIDRSGSMVDVFDMVKYEMRKSIALLNEDQYFHVIFFSEGQPIETKPRGLVPATDNNKLRCGRWLDEIVPCGQTDPIPALERAFDVLSHADSPKGKLIYLLTVHSPITRRCSSLSAPKTATGAYGYARSFTVKTEKKRLCGC